MSADAVTAIVAGDIALIAGCAALLGELARRCGQPAVVGQVVAGISLGPTLLGRLPGHLVSRLYPPLVLSSLTILAQVGIVIFMFVVGYEMNSRLLKGHGRAVALLAAGAFAVPMLLGSGSSLLFPGLFAGSAGPHGAGHSMTLFVGVAVSITALPVLAAIIRERDMADTDVGTLATAAACVMDVAAWLALAVIIAGSASGPIRSIVVRVILLGGWAAVLQLAVRPLLARLMAKPLASLTYQVPAAVVLAMTSACVTSALGLHVFIGGLLAGLAMPRSGGGPDADVLRSMEGAGGLLLPLFFVVTGLSLNIGALRPGELGLFGLLLAVACAGKLMPGYVASRLGGLPRRRAAATAALVNTRGLTELIALNAGLTSGIISAKLFTILVLVALVTTVSTAPLLSLLGWPSRRPAERGAAGAGLTGSADRDGSRPR